MLVFSVKASSIKFFCTIALCVAVLVALVIYIPTLATPNADSEIVQTASEVKFDGIKTNEDRIAFLSSFGWEVKPECVEEKKVTIPDEFDRVYTGYNEIQRNQGLDLSNYRKKEVDYFCYQITNYPEYDGEVYATLLVYRDTVIGGDISSADPAGFVQGFAKK